MNKAQLVASKEEECDMVFLACNTCSHHLARTFGKNIPYEPNGFLLAETQPLHGLRCCYNHLCVNESPCTYLLTYYDVREPFGERQWGLVKLCLDFEEILYIESGQFGFQS